MNGKIKTEDRVWAALAHLSALVTGFGLPVPVVGWAEQRRKSKYASFHCLQALGYQTLGYTVWFLFSGVLIIIFVVILLLTSNTAGGMDAVGDLMSISIALIFCLLGGYFLIPLAGAIACALGKEFRYPFLGNPLARYLEYSVEDEGWLNEDHEDRWVAAMGHFSVIIPMWGILAPLVTWMLQGNRSYWLKSQAVQTSVFQLLVTVIFLSSIVLALMGTIPVILFAGTLSDPASSFQPAVFGVFMLFMLACFVLMLLLPLFHILGQWAGYRVLKGDDYRYPVLGNFVGKYLDSRKT